MKAAVVITLALAACQSPSDRPTPARSETAAAMPRAQPEAASQAASTEVVPSSAPVVRKPFCDRTFDERTGRKVVWPPPGVKLNPPLERKGPLWINFWAAWCKPCRQEIPQLMAWAKEWNVQLAFVSVDDDEREWRGGVDKLGLGGLSSPLTQIFAGNARKWAQSAGLGETLPAHAIIDGNSRLRCLRTGAVEDVDGTSFRAYLTGLR